MKYQIFLEYSIFMDSCNLITRPDKLREENRLQVDNTLMVWAVQSHPERIFTRHTTDPVPIPIECLGLNTRKQSKRLSQIDTRENTYSVKSRPNLSIDLWTSLLQFYLSFYSLVAINDIIFHFYVFMLSYYWLMATLGFLDCKVTSRAIIRIVSYLRLLWMKHCSGRYNSRLDTWEIQFGQVSIQLQICILPLQL